MTLYEKAKELKLTKVRPKSKYNFDMDEKTGKEIGCHYENGTWCNLPKFKRCEDCLRCTDGSKACGVTAF